jgi:hypothetical protein
MHLRCLSSLFLLVACTRLASASPDVLSARLREAIATGGTYAANALLDPSGQSRCDYDLLTGQWAPYEPAWHTGQIILGLVEAHKITGDPHLLQRARDAGNWWISLEITDHPKLKGMVRAIHGAGINNIIFATVSDGTAGLFALSRLTGDPRYADVSTRAGAWMLRHLYVPAQGVFYDAVDPDSGEVLTERSPFWPEKKQQVLTDVARPNNEGSLYKDMYLHTGDTRYREVFLAVCDSLVAKQGPEGLWMEFTPNDASRGRLHPRFNLWYAESLLEGYELTRDPRYLAAARRTLVFYTKLQKKNGTIYYENFLNGTATENSPSGSTVAFAGLLWLRLIQLGAGEGFEQPLDRSLQWVLANRYPATHPDPNLAGGFFNLRTSARGPLLRLHHRDIGTAFALRFLAAYYHHVSASAKP